jgi:DNA-binding GntR family transcriptional regulator
MAADDTYEKLKTMIYRGQLDSGQRIVERELASELGVSRIPLREGMVRLENEGLIRSVPNSSNYVATFGPRDLIEIYSMRVWLEPPATRLATLRKDDKLIRTLENWCAKMEHAQDNDEISRVDDCDYQFHYAIVQASGHTRLQRAYEIAHIRITSFYSDFLTQKAADPKRLVRQHEQIVRAIERGDPDRAEKVAYDHVYRSLDMFEKKLGVYLVPRNK